jgi:transposase
MQSTTTIGFDLAKDIFQVHGVDHQQKVTVARQLRRRDVLSFFAKLPPCLVGMEACASAHYWARELIALGHRVKIMSPRPVKAFVKRGKTDAADAAAICEAVSRAHVDAVAIKSRAQQEYLMLHKAREMAIDVRTQTQNAIRAHLAEVGIIDAAGHKGFATLAAGLRDETDARMSATLRAALLPLLALHEATERSLAALEVNIRAAAKACTTTQRLETIPGVGMLTAAAFAATVTASDAQAYKSARHFAASLGLTPRVCGSGGETQLGSITKQGNRHLRQLLYLGAVARLGFAKRAPHKADPALLRLLCEKPFKVAAIALANRTARIIWALLARGGTFIADHLPALPVGRELARQ